MKGTRRVALLALPAVAAAAALLCVAGGAYARDTADQALAVAVDGPGTVSGTGISCRDGSGDCVDLYVDGISVTLTAASDPGATFAGWGGDCSAATGTTCTLTMSSARAVTATFTSGGGGSNPMLTVTPTGNGKVTGPGIDCGNGATDCSESYATGTAVTLTEIPSAGATFSGWGGACTGTNTTCSVTMTASRSVTATFSVGTGAQTLTVSVNGRGKVTGTGISCGGDEHDCLHAYKDNGAVTLTATPTGGAVFLGWGGACTGTGRVCNLVMDSPKAVFASFGTPGSHSGGTRTFAVRSLGRPIVVRTSVGWAVTLRFQTSRSAAALLRLSRNGRAVNAFTFSPRAGDVLVGPFNIGSRGAYVFRLTLSDGRGNSAALIWNLCIVSCTSLSFRLAVSFVRGLGATAQRTPSGWVIEMRFQASGAGSATVRVTCARRLVSTGNFNFRRGPVAFDVPARSPGLHRITMTARSASGRTMILRWNVLLR